MSFLCVCYLDNDVKDVQGFQEAFQEMVIRAGLGKLSLPVTRCSANMTIGEAPRPPPSSLTSRSSAPPLIRERTVARSPDQVGITATACRTHVVGGR
ncbi:hypothetical protein GALMADRAFT_223964 [Galerina marginata CBS 339.88]|uniref:Uncharacterized protein n=1 Tax=Galerina marginata (strain CBS 339.88) TaxID=685588 RepID=A0A067TFL7_GALM3|nr:hypothetical protein GALMADRAFT_223964 [Galerina marginata CBS 339.88]